MSLQSTDIRKIYERKRNEQSKAKLQLMNEKIKKQIEDESQLIQQKQEQCYNTVDATAYPDFCETLLLNLLVTQFYDPQVMESIRCIMTSIFDQQNQNISFQYWLKHWITSLQLTESDIQEYTMSGSLQTIKDVFTIKFPRETSKPNKTVHELFIGLFGTNKLRQYIPNFAYVFSGFSCSRPFLEGTKVLAYCNTVEKPYKTNYTLYEKIHSYPGSKEDSTSLTLYLRTCTADEFLNLYLQILYALHIGYTMSGFTHYNLHTDKILLRFLDSHIYIPYITDHVKPQEVEYLKTNIIATITDYSMARISYSEKSYGVDGYSMYSVDPENPYPLYDAYKLFMYSMETAIKYDNISVLTMGKKIFNLFNPNEPLEYAISQQADIFYHIPPITNFPPSKSAWPNTTIGSSDLLTLANGMRGLLGSPFITNIRPDKAILTCKSMGGLYECNQNSETIIKTLFACKSDTITSSFNFSFKLKILINSKQTEEIQHVIQQGESSAPEVINKETVILNKVIDVIIKETQEIEANTFKRLNPTPESVEKYIASLNKLASIIQNFQFIQINYVYLKFLADVYKHEIIDPTKTLNIIREWIQRWIKDYIFVLETLEHLPDIKLPLINKLRSFKALTVVTLSPITEI